MSFATTKERLVYFIDKQDISVKEFLTKTNIKRGFLDSDKLKATVSDIFITKIIASYPDLNLEWLITGKGEMLKEALYKKDLVNDESKVYEISDERKILYEEIIKSKEDIIAAKENHLIEKDVVIKSTERLNEKSENMIETLNEHINLLKMMLHQNDKN